MTAPALHGRAHNQHPVFRSGNPSSHELEENWSLFVVFYLEILIFPGCFKLLTLKVDLPLFAG